MKKFNVGDVVKFDTKAHLNANFLEGFGVITEVIENYGMCIKCTYFECGKIQQYDLYFYNDQVEIMEQENKWNDWIIWNGGEMPVKAGEMVKVCHRDGEVYEEPAGERYSGDWEHTDHDGDIVAYCTLKQDAPKSENSVTIGGAASSEHYINDAMQPIEIMQMTFSHEEMLGFLKGNIIKYSFRAGKKQGESAEKDLNKVKQYKMWLDIVLKGGVINPRTDVI